MSGTKKKIAIALSGGVDSAVAAKILKDEGNDMVGLFLKLWSAPMDCKIARENRCCDYKALEDAREVAHKLKMPFYVINAEKEFKQLVVDAFIDDYQNLKTPNPCIVCNQKIKFDLLLRKALAIGCDFLATGHYARIEDSGISNSKLLMSKKILNIKSQISNNNATMKQCNNDNSIYSDEVADKTRRLYSGIDGQKDQSYMLYRLDQRQLSKIIFPLGGMTKKAVRAKAVKWDLPVKEKPESQEICFTGEKDFRHFLKNYLPASCFRPGNIVNAEGKILGRHNGLVNYTIGQRKGVDQSLFRGDNEKTPLYVIKLKRETNELVVGDDSEVYENEMIVSNLNWINKNRKIEDGDRVSVRIRYHHPLVSGKAEVRGDRIKITFDQKERAITPGQSAVFYSDDEVIGGGIIR